MKISRVKPKLTSEFGDFQTPDSLAIDVLSVLGGLNLNPSSILEPSCGRGSFLSAASSKFQDARLFGLDINLSHVENARSRIINHKNAEVVHDNFFDYDWEAQLNKLSSPILVLGNPPWITNSSLGLIGSENLPRKSNFQKIKGIDALTGKSNFDISEWMLLKNVDWIVKRSGYIAVLCKTAVARKVLMSAWKRNLPISEARIYSIDALSNFGAAVEACLFFVKTVENNSSKECLVYENLHSSSPVKKFGYLDGTLVSDAVKYKQFEFLRTSTTNHKWRSGIKHDSAKVMELRRDGSAYVNGFGEKLYIENTYVFPLIKSSDISGSRNKDRQLFMLVPQRFVGEDTKSIARIAPKTWNYLQSHRSSLAKRTSVIYRGKPEFSVFGVGDYTFSPWKIAISSMYKKINFDIYGDIEGKPIVFDDTVYFLPFDNYDDAKTVFKLLSSDMAKDFLSSMIFWDEKRPITADLLKRIDINTLAKRHGYSEVKSFSDNSKSINTNSQMSLLV